MDRIELTRANLARLPSVVRVPGYDTAQVRPGIVHLGLGGFHRAHMARYTHDLMQRRPDTLTWGIAGAGLTASDRRMRDSLVPQDNLYTLVEREGETQTIAVIGALAEVIFAADDSTALLAVMDRPDIRIVSLTVTEHGYCLNRSTKRLDPDHPLIQRDLGEPARPASAIGIIVESLRRRRAAGVEPFTALSCDNIQHNGTVLRDAVLALALLRDAELADWIRHSVSFPSTMVDRITPVTTEADMAWLTQQTGIVDRWPVFCEPFTQWVIEDLFPLGRPAWEEVGAQFVPDVAPYEFMKLRLLNASHLAVAGLGRLAGYETIDEAMGQGAKGGGDIARYMRVLMDRETGPTVPDVPGIDLEDYKATLLKRFSNTAIKDTVERVNTDAPLNILVDPIRDRLAGGQPISLLALALAAWLRRVRGEDEQGRAIVVKHPLAEVLRTKAIEGGPDPRPLLSLTSLFGETGTDPRLIEPVGRWLGQLYRDGARKTLREAAQSLRF
jgi:mannitol 2-dehydrogenase